MSLILVFYILYFTFLVLSYVFWFSILLDHFSDSQYPMSLAFPACLCPFTFIHQLFLCFLSVKTNLFPAFSCLCPCHSHVSAHVIPVSLPLSFPCLCPCHSCVSALVIPVSLPLSFPCLCPCHSRVSACDFLPFIYCFSHFHAPCFLIHQSVCPLPVYSLAVITVSGCEFDAFLTFPLIIFMTIF